MPGDHGRHGGVGEHVPEREIGHVVRLDAEVLRQRRDVLRHLGGPVAGEVPGAEVAVLEARIRGDAAGQAALVERDAHDHADAVLLASGQQLLLGLLVEHVVDDLHRVDGTGADQGEPVLRLVIVDRDAEEADLPLLLQRLHGLEPVAVPHPVVAPDVELQHVEGVEAALLQARLEAGADVLTRERLLDGDALARRPLAVLRRHLRRDDEPLAGVLAQDPADDLLAPAVAAGGVDEGAAELDEALERLHRLVVLRADPAASRTADAPGAVPDLGDLHARPTQLSIPHVMPFVASRHPPTGGLRARRKRRGRRDVTIVFRLFRCGASLP